MDLRVITDNLWYMMLGFRLTVILAVVGMGLSLVIGTLLGMARLTRLFSLRYPAILYIELMRSTPLIMVIFWIFFLLPKITRTPLEATTSGLIALVAFYSSHVAEIMRAGIQSIPKGQMDAGLSAGLGYIRTMRYVILPQAIRNMIPALVTRFVSLFMATSLMYIIGVVDFFRAATIVNNREFQSFKIYTFVALVYFVSCFSISHVGRWCERKLGVRRFESVEASLGW